MTKEEQDNQNFLAGKVLGTVSLKASEVIALLTTAIQQHGDLEVRISDDMCQRTLEAADFSSPYFVEPSDDSDVDVFCL